jgi:pimeloyl-ACP methyl ester carboxylesterase
VLLHAAAANAHWWRFVAPALTDRHDVVALDLSGHGASGWRAAYSLTAWADDVLTLIQELDLTRPLLVGHSLGGRTGLVVTARHGAQVDGLILVDTAVYPADREIVIWTWPTTYRPPVFPDRETAIRRYALVPRQNTVNEPIRRFLAAESLKETPGGLTWQFDPAITAVDTEEALVRDLLLRTRGRTALIYGEQSEIVPADTVAYMADHGGLVEVVGIPAAQHHVFVDQPQAFVTVLRSVLDSWPSA